MRGGGSPMRLCITMSLIDPVPWSRPASGATMPCLHPTTANGAGKGLPHSVPSPASFWEPAPGGSYGAVATPGQPRDAPGSRCRLVHVPRPAADKCGMRPRGLVLEFNERGASGLALFVCRLSQPKGVSTLSVLETSHLGRPWRVCGKLSHCFGNQTVRRQKHTNGAGLASNTLSAVSCALIPPGCDRDVYENGQAPASCNLGVLGQCERHVTCVCVCVCVPATDGLSMDQVAGETTTKPVCGVLGQSIRHRQLPLIILFRKLTVA
ncbi:hypothetical protein GGTG_00467 [Gaeumannomyces tritici R3-111a-1]|uniref:Uncharacterized protein n=1 Tax=Gaeumannomyces tritici (strain R3-111a-1) TaxID=644352 RepID=J3NGS8_GAET3|nr:hypothetical protein GGTG_00467 [Gaeumannomyces tritici R3-111a-1]EJT80468.1 hypothetical protein GGTG_00467 [Gaeumannomyces tritici R3-111a-1]